MSWLSNAVSWVQETAEGLSNYLTDTAGSAWDTIGSTFGFETMAQKERQRLKDEARDAWNAKRKELTDSWEAYKNEWTGAGGAQKAYDLAKSATGSITAQQVEGAVKEAERASRSVGVNKAQSSLNASNIAANQYANSYDVEGQQTKIQDQFDAQAAEMENMYNNETSLGQSQFDAELARIDSLKQSDLDTRIKITSDENEKEDLLEVNSDICALHLLTVLRDFEPQNEEDLYLIKLALQFLDLYSRRKKCSLQKEKE